jgi:hypothetical protein
MMKATAVGLLVAMQERLILPADTMSYQLLTCRRSDVRCRAAHAYRPYMTIWGSAGARFEGFDHGAEDLDGSVGGCCEINCQKIEKFPCHGN